MREAEQKLKKLSRLRKNQLNKYVQKHPIKVVRSPQNEFYIVDHHHLLAVLWLLGVKKVPVRVTKTFATRNMTSFRTGAQAGRNKRGVHRHYPCHTTVSVATR